MRASFETGAHVFPLAASRADYDRDIDGGRPSL